MVGTLPAGTGIGSARITSYAQELGSGAGACSIRCFANSVAAAASHWSISSARSQESTAYLVAILSNLTTMTLFGTWHC